ncbi:hypothetical protein BHM03_00026389 [Ensete ventricosum]|nr:hypothetical protein BHM03_00026389 [Ensete ventricosum]
MLRYDHFTNMLWTHRPMLTSIDSAVSALPPREPRRTHESPRSGAVLHRTEGVAKSFAGFDSGRHRRRDFIRLIWIRPSQSTRSSFICCTRCAAGERIFVACGVPLLRRTFRRTPAEF